MISLITSIAPIIGGFLMKLIAIKSKAAQDSLNLAIMANKSNADIINQAREQSNKESPMAALNRRVIIFVILSLIVFSLIAPVVFDIPTAVPIVHEGFSFLGFQFTADEVEYQLVSGLIKYDEIWAFASTIINFYFGSQLAKG